MNQSNFLISAASTANLYKTISPVGIFFCFDSLPQQVLFTNISITNQFCCIQQCKLLLLKNCQYQQFKMDRFRVPQTELQISFKRSCELCSLSNCISKPKQNVPETIHFTFFIPHYQHEKNIFLLNSSIKICKVTEHHHKSPSNTILASFTPSKLQTAHTTP